MAVQPKRVTLPRGTIINSLLVAVGALVGWQVGRFLPVRLGGIVMSGLGLVTVGLGIKMFLQGKSLMGMAGAIAVGGIVGTLAGFDYGFNVFVEWVKGHLAGSGNAFTTTMLTTSLLYCVGPMTILGCLQDGLEGKYQTLALKGLLDGVGAIFFAASGDPLGVFCSACVVLVVQGTLTLLARPLSWLGDDSEMIDEITGTGGLLLLAIGLGLLKVKDIPVVNFLPALLVAPGFVGLGRRWRKA